MDVKHSWWYNFSSCFTTTTSVLYDSSSHIIHMYILSAFSQSANISTLHFIISSLVYERSREKFHFLSPSSQSLCIKLAHLVLCACALGVHPLAVYFLRLTGNWWFKSWRLKTFSELFAWKPQFFTQLNDVKKLNWLVKIFSSPSSS